MRLRITRSKKHTGFLLAVMAVLPFVGFGCLSLDHYTAPTGLAPSNLTPSQSPPYEKVREVFQKWATSQHLEPSHCRKDAMGDRGPCDAYMVHYEECGLAECAKYPLRIALTDDPLQIQFFDFGHSTQSKKVAELQASLKSAIERAFGKDAVKIKK